MRFDEILTPRVDKVQLVDRLNSHPNIQGTVHITTTHMIFRSDEGNKELWIANGLIGSVERGPLSVSGCPLIIRCKHFRVINFLISRDKSCQDLFEELVKCSKPVNVSELLAFENRDDLEDAKGWARLDWQIEFSRQGVDDNWKETDLNMGYKNCDTYPDQVWVPTSANKSILMGSCQFRSRGRLPVLTYYYRPNGAALCRCAQPLTGFSARCVEDEKLMELIGKANKNCETLYLVDTRPIVNAMVNKVQGKGFEDEKNYANMRFYSFDIENIHVMRTSQQKMLDACVKARTMTDYLKGIEMSGWLKHLKAVVECAQFLATSLATGVSCVVHCSDGWDRTSQTVALAELLVDPFYRTIHGFQVLVEKDWLAFGHKFDDRCGHVGAFNDEAAKEVSPIFSQFLDCVYQVMRQAPRAFEFNERYLIDIHEHVYACQYGTFIGNCDKDRKDLALAKRTKSLWTLFDGRKEDYMNPFYEPTTFGCIYDDIDTRAAAFVIWTAMYNRFDEGLQLRENITDSVMASIEHVGVLEAHVSALKMRIAELKQQLGKGGSGSMADSGHSSNEGQNGDEKGPLPPERALSRESGVYDQSLSCAEEGLTKQALRWSSLRDATHCIGCNAEFVSVIERRIHCHRCGKIFCRRCVYSSADDRELLCRSCQSV